MSQTLSIVSNVVYREVFCRKLSHSSFYIFPFMKGTNNYKQHFAHCLYHTLCVFLRHVFVSLLFCLFTYLLFPLVLPLFKPFSNLKKEVQQPSVVSRPRSRNFSSSSEKYFVNQINMSLNGIHSDETEVKTGSLVSMNNQALESEEMQRRDSVSGIEEKGRLIIPADDEIEKSFRVNQDGSMTVEMKVRLTIKQEEMIHWTTTVSRACVNSQEMAAGLQPVSGYSSPNHKGSNNNRNTESNVDDHESKDENTQTYKSIKLNQEGKNHSGNATFKAVRNPKPCFRRPPTPGPRRSRRIEASVEKIEKLSQTEVQESTVGTHSYVEHMAEAELMEEYCVVSRSSSSSTRPVPKPRKKHFKGAKHNKTHFSYSGMAEILQLHNNEKETVMHIHQSQDAKTWPDEDDRFEHKKPDSSGSGPQSPSNDRDTNLTKPSASSGNARSSEHSSLLSGQSDLSQTISNNAYCLTDHENQARCKSSDKGIETSTKEDLKSKVLSKKSKMSQRSKLRAHTKEKLDIIPSSHSTSFKILTKHRSVNGSITKAPKESKDLSESVSMPVLHSSPCSVHQYVENWLEKTHPESVPYMDELNMHEPRARFQIESDFSDISEMRSELDIDNLAENCASVKGFTVKKPGSQQLVQIRSEEEPMETQNLKRSCKSMPSFLHAAEQKIGTRNIKSSNDLVSKLSDAACGTSPNTQLKPGSGMKDVLEQLCSSVQFTRRTCSLSHLSSTTKAYKSSSLPDLSSQLASVFGSPSKTFLSFLTVMTLRDGIANHAREHSGSANNIDDNSGSNPEALRVMQSIQKIASIEDEEKLKTSLTSLHSSASAQLKKSWTDFQEKNNIKESRPVSPRQSEREFALEVNSEEGGEGKGHVFGIREVMDELNLCEDPRREITSLVLGNLTNIEEAKSTSGYETPSFACENKDDAMKDDLGGSSEEENIYLEERERYVNREPSKAGLCEEKHEIMDNFQMMEEEQTEDEIGQAAEFYMPDYSPTNPEDKAEQQKSVNGVQSESELLSPTSGIWTKHAGSNSEGCGINSKEDDTCSETEPELQKAEEESVTEIQSYNANEDDEKIDADEGFDATPNTPLQPHQKVEYSDHSESDKSQEPVAELDLQTSQEESVGQNPARPAEEKEDETDEHDKQSSALDKDKDLDTQSSHCYFDDPSINDLLRRESCQIEENHRARSEDSTGRDEADMNPECCCVHPAVLPQQLLDFVNLALTSSALIFTYDSNGCLRIEADRCKNQAMSLFKSSQRCLPSPNTSELSDYRPDTSDSRGDMTPISTDLLTDSGGDEAEKLFVYQSNVRQSSENINKNVNTLDNVLMRSHPDRKQKASPNVKSMRSPGSIPDSICCNSLDSELAQCPAFPGKTDSEEGILIDKGRWLLKENHLIRKSPPVPMGMYENAETTSVDTGQENNCEDACYIPCGRKQSQLAVISSSELEDMAKPSTPKCKYFNMSHSSDSEPFPDGQSTTSNKERGFVRRSKGVAPLGETLKMSAKKNGSLPSFTSAEFRLAAGKVHPEDGVASRVAEKSPRSKSNMPHEEESVEGLSLRCGQHCPIL